MSPLTSLNAQFFNASLVAVNGATAGSALQANAVEEADLTLLSQTQLQTSGEGVLEALPNLFGVRPMEETGSSSPTFALATVIKGAASRISPGGRVSQETQWTAQPALNGGRRKSLKTRDLPEDRAARKLENFFRMAVHRVKQFRLWGRLKNLFWDPIDLDRITSWQWTKVEAKKRGQTMKHGKRSFFWHETTNPVTQRLISIIQTELRRINGKSQKPVLAELGSGNGKLAQIVHEQTGVTILETDWIPARQNTQPRLQANMTALPIRTGAASLALASFSMEYATPRGRAFRETHRILAPGGMLIALVHHAQSLIARRTIIDSMVVGGFRWIKSLRPLRALIPNFLLLPWEITARHFHDLVKCAFTDELEVIKLLKQNGFTDIDIEVAKAPPVALWDPSKIFDIGWIVTARKPKK